MKKKHDPFGNPVIAPKGAPVPLFTVVGCPRCAKPCLIRATTPPRDMPFISLVPATTGNGLCEECAAHWWIFTIDGFRWSFQDEPGVLALPTVQRELGRMLSGMHPAIGALDWTRLLAQWDLPWPDDWTLAKDG